MQHCFISAALNSGRDYILVKPTKSNRQMLNTETLYSLYAAKYECNNASSRTWHRPQHVSRTKNSSLSLSHLALDLEHKVLDMITSLYE